MSYVYGVATLRLIAHWASIVVEYAQGVLDHIQDNSRDSWMRVMGRGRSVPVVISFIIRD